MSKLDEMKRAFGSNVSDSFGTSVPAGTMPPGLASSDAQRMPARLQGISKARDAAIIPTGRIEPDPDQPREDFGSESLGRLAESLKTKGQLQPIRVRWDDGRGCYVIVAGERRWRAAVKAGLPTLSCVIHEAPADPGELLSLQLVENALREDLRPVEQARAYKKLMALNGWSGNQLAKELAIDQSGISRALALLDLPEAVQAKVDAGELATRTAADLSRLNDPAVQLALAEQAAAGLVTRDQVQATVKAHRAGRSVTAVARKDYKLPDGTKVALSGPGGASPEAAVAALRGALKLAQAELKQSGPGRAA
jgi:ParB family chromosome partitioning protein